MKAFRIYGPRDGRYEELPDPQIGPDDALLRPRAVTVCGTDLEIYQGTMFYFTSGLASTRSSWGMNGLPRYCRWEQTSRTLNRATKW